MRITNLYNIKGDILGEVELPDYLFSAEISEYAVYETVRAYMVNQRQGTVSTKRRGEVVGSGRKPWRQKGTGRARVGSIRNPVWRGGGVVFGPKPRDYSIKISPKIKKKALLSALTGKAEMNLVWVIDAIQMEKPNTAGMVKNLKKFGLQKPLILLEPKDTNTILSLRNIQWVEASPVNELNAYNVLNHKELVVTKEALSKLEARFSDARSI